MATILLIALTCIILGACLCGAYYLRRMRREITQLRAEVGRARIEHALDAAAHDDATPIRQRRHLRAVKLAAGLTTAGGAWLVQALRPRTIALAGGAVATGAIAIVPGSMPPHMQAEAPHTTRAILTNHPAPGPADLAPDTPAHTSEGAARADAGPVTITPPPEDTQAAREAHDPGPRDSDSGDTDSDLPATPETPADSAPDAGPPPAPRSGPDVEPPGNPDAPGRGLGDQPPPGLTRGNGPPGEQPGPPGL